MFQDEEEDFFLGVEDSRSDSEEEPPRKKRKSTAALTPRVEGIRGSGRKPKATPRTKRVAATPVVPKPSDSEVSVLSELEKNPKFYSSFASAVKAFTCLYDRCDPCFRTNKELREKCWTKVAKNANFKGSPEEIEAEWRCVEKNYRQWRQDKARKEEGGWDEGMVTVFGKMKWVDRGLLSWVEKSPLMMAMAALNEEHVARTQYPSRRRTNKKAVITTTAAADVFDVPEKEPVLSTGRLSRGSRRSALGSLMKFPTATPGGKDHTLEITPLLRRSRRRTSLSTSADELSGMSPAEHDESKVSAVFDQKAASSPHSEWSDRSDSLEI